MIGAKIFTEVLRDEGVKHIFGYPGGAVLDIYDALYDSDLEHFLVRHEQAASHAADGYARSTGKVGVCLATSGPGATNLVTGIATAHMDSVPMVAFTGQVPTAGLGKDSFQEADVFGITMPITKHNFLIRNVSELAQTIKEAFHIAKTGRPGPVLVDLPRDVAWTEGEYEKIAGISIESYRISHYGNIKDIRNALELIRKAERPVIMAGHGIIISQGSEELRMFAEKISSPVCCTLMGLGCFSDLHRLSLKMPGMHGTAYANYALHEADLIIGIGMRFDDRITGKLTGFASNADVIHIDIDAAEIGKRVDVTVGITGDAKSTLKTLLDCIEEDGHDFGVNKHSWITRINELKNKYPLSYTKSDSVIKPQFILETLDSMIRKENVIITTDVGEHQMWTAQYINYTRPRMFASSGGLGTMGYGLPAAMGAQVANPKSTVINISGDGSIQMNIQELSTIAFYNLPVKIFIFNNYHLGMVRQWQELFFKQRYSHSKMEGMQPDFMKLAEAYSIKGLRCKDPKKVKHTLEEALSHPGPVLVDFQIDPQENIYPMVPVGKFINEMIFERDM